MKEISQSRALEGLAGKSILITGASGYLATALLRRIQDVNCRIICLTRSKAVPGPVQGKARVRSFSGDIRQYATWDRVLKGVDVVFHFAAQTSARTANEDPAADWKINVLPLLHLLEVCRQKSWKPSVLFASTVTVAGIPKYLPMDESHQENPLTIYDLHKQMAERYLKYYASRGFVSGVILRLANVFGPGPQSGSEDRGMLNKMMRKALSGEVLTIYGSGDSLRDYVYVEDVIRAFLEAASEMKRVNQRHFIIGSGEGHTIAQVLRLVSERAALKTAKRVDVVHAEPPPSTLEIDTRNFVADSQAFTQATGWRPRVSLAQGIDETLEVLL